MIQLQQPMQPFQQPMPSMQPSDGQTLDQLPQPLLALQGKAKAILQGLHNEHVHDTWIESYIKPAEFIKLKAIYIAVITLVVCQLLTGVRDKEETYVQLITRNVNY
jgi:hypothetical protein